MNDHRLHLEYWESEWNRRIRDDGVILNVQKAQFLIEMLWKRPHWRTLEKLEIGCGPGFHASALSDMYIGWRETYTGIDISEKAIAYAEESGLNVEVADIYSYQTDKKFSVFLILDTLEHLLAHDLLSDRIRELAEPQYEIFGNIPLYLSQHPAGIVERPMNISVVSNFLKMCGLKPKVKVYGINGYPYMFFLGKQ